jgi:cytochrome c553
MAAFVATLTDEDISDLAAYYAAQKGLFTLSR